MRSAFVTLALFLIAAPRQGDACSCVVVARPGEPLLASGRPVPSLAALEWYDAVFLGRVAEVSSLPAEMPEGARELQSGRVARFDVERAWRGRDVGPSTEVLSPAAGGACGHAFVPGEVYLVFARVHRGPVPLSPGLPAVDVLTTNICALTTPMPLAEDLLSVVERLLGPGRQVVEPKGEAP